MKLLIYWMIVLALVMVCRNEQADTTAGILEKIPASQENNMLPKYGDSLNGNLKQPVMSGNSAVVMF